VLLSGDTVACTPDERWVSFMRSLPNKIPLSAAVVAKVADRVLQLDFDRLYDTVAGLVTRDAAGRVRRSADRYIAWGAKGLRPPHRLISTSGLPVQPEAECKAKIVSTGQARVHEPREACGGLLRKTGPMRCPLPGRWSESLSGGAIRCSRSRVRSRWVSCTA
jgi:hypothetical protein